jgi:DNA-binding NarL/FixJ family response regulator
VLHEDALSDAWLAELAPSPEAVDALVSEGWLHETRAGFWSLEPTLDRAALRPLVPWSQRRGAHLALAHVLQRERTHRAAAATHFAAAGWRDDAARLWLAAAREHCRQHHHRLAAECFAQAVPHLPAGLDEEELVAAVRDFGTCATLQRATGSALELIRTWRELPALTQLHVFQGEAARVHASLLEHEGRHVDAAQQRRGAAHAFICAARPAEAAAELVAAGTTLVFALHLTAARDAISQAVATARTCGRTDLEVQATILLGLILGMRGETDAGRRELESALDLALGAGLTTYAADAYVHLGSVQEYASCDRDEQAAFRRALSYCERHNEGQLAALCLGCFSYSLFRSGNWRRSNELARRILATRSSPPVSRGVASCVLGVLQAHRGESRPALHHLQASMMAARQTGVAALQFFSLWGEALVHELAGNLDSAAASYRRLMEFWLTTEDRHDVVPGFTTAVVFFATQHDRAQAADFAGALQQIAAANPNPEMTGAAELAAGELELLDGRPREACAALANAVRAYEQRELTVELIRARIRLGAALAAAGEPARASVALREARLRAARLGARPLAAQATAHIEALGAPDSPAPADPWDSLSPRQRDVARHLAAGRTNKEIATALALSVRTVDMHVAHLLARLDCRTRSAAAARLTALLAG